MQVERATSGTRRSARRPALPPLVVKGKKLEDIVEILRQGADAVQMGMRFLATVESRVLKQSPMFRAAVEGRRKPACNKGYVLLKGGDGKYSRCAAKEHGAHCFCICDGLLSSAGYNPREEEPLCTVGSNACRVESVVPVRTLMDELRGAATPSRASARRSLPRTLGAGRRRGGAGVPCRWRMTR